MQSFEIQSLQRSKCNIYLQTIIKRALEYSKYSLRQSNVFRRDLYQSACSLQLIFLESKHISLKCLKEPAACHPIKAIPGLFQWQTKGIQPWPQLLECSEKSSVHYWMSFWNLADRVRNHRLVHYCLWPPVSKTILLCFWYKEIEFLAVSVCVLTWVRACIYAANTN